MDSSCSPPLTLSEARSRSSVLSLIHYDLFLDFTPHQQFSGSVSVSFHYQNNAPTPVWLDADGRS